MTVTLLEAMLRGRRFDEALLANADLVRGHFHVSIGLEATAAALVQVRREGDLIATTYRNHAHLAALGTDPAAMLAEAFGRDLGPQRGRAGSTHLVDPARGVPHTSAMVSGGVPIALGYGLALARTRPGAVCFCFFGDGAFGEGSVHEALNLARLWELPVVFVCENNAAPGAGQANDYQAAASLVTLAEANRIPGAAVDAREPRRVLDALMALTNAVRAGAGPWFLDAQGPCWPGNATFFPSDATGPLDLRTAGEPASDGWPADDPIRREVARLLGEGAPLGDLLAVDARVRAGLDAAVARARAAPVAPAAAALDEVLGR